MKSELKENVDLIYDEVVSIRRKLHQMPELGINLPNTLNYVKGKLLEYGYEPEVIANSGIKATLNGNIEGKTILLRADMDALSIREETPLEYASKNGNMHGCGHDLHTAMLLGAAKILKKMQVNIKGKVVFMFQPGEETLEGAKLMIENNILDGVDIAMGLHVFPAIPVKSGIVITPMAGAMLSSATRWSIEVKGKGTHGAMPENGVDTITIMCEILNAIKHIKSHELNQYSNLVLTCGQFNAGTAANILPEKGILKGTLRTTDDNLSKFVLKRMKEIAENIAIAYRGEATLSTEISVPTTVNDVVVAKEATDIFEEWLGVENTIPFKKGVGRPLSGSEDFSHVLLKVPGVFVGITAGNLSEGYTHPLHDNKVEFDESALKAGVLAYCSFVLGQK